MKTYKKIIGCCLAIFIAAIWAVRYYTLNDGFSVKYYSDREYYNMGEIIEYGDEPIGYKQSCEGYSIRVNDVSFYDGDEYVDLYSEGKDVSISYWPDQVVEVDITLFNSDNETGEGIQFYPMQLVGCDWFGTISPELVALANPIYHENGDKRAQGIIIRPNSSYDIKLAYGLSKQYLNSYFPENRRNNLQDEEIWLEITKIPTNKMIKLF